MNWVAVGLCADVPPGTVVPARVSHTDLAVWCSAEGKYHAWGDRCPHRGMRLSHGFVRGETLACIYHGWQYDDDGTCRYIPAHPKLDPPKTICAREYVCKYQHETIWVALEPTGATIPDVGERRPVRSLDVTASAGDIAKRLGQTASSLVVVGGPHDLALALQPATDDSCVVHAFAGWDQDRKTVSRYLEQLRADLEAAA